MKNKDYLSTNQKVWDEWADIHIKGSSFYPVEQFKAGTQGWKPNVPDDIGPLDGKSILHLQCHFGQDTLSLGRLVILVWIRSCGPVWALKSRVWIFLKKP